MNETFLTMKGIYKAFPGVQALSDVDLQVKAGTVHALLGENGAGKSTLMKILSGVHRPDRGTISIEGKTEGFHGIKDAEKAGIAIIYQELNLIEAMTVTENIFLAREHVNRWGIIDRKKMALQAKQELQRLDVAIEPDTRIQDLRVGEQQLVEIAKALSVHARLVIMDEPTSALSDTEIEKLFSVIETLKKKGVATIYISHKIEEIFSIADRVTVLRDGRVVGNKEVAQATPQVLINMMVGRDLDDLFPKHNAPHGQVMLQVKNLSVKHPVLQDRHLLKNISFSLHKGEIVGLAGLMGAGRTELMMTLFGAPPGVIASGTMTINGKPCSFSSPDQAIDHGLALVTEDRKAQGLFLQLSVHHNLTIAGLKNFVKNRLIDSKKEKHQIDEYIQSLNIKIPKLSAAIETLSGGNQQKVILAKWLMTKPTILLLDEPTRGIDVGAKAELYHLINLFVSQGMGILLVSSELPELLALCDRILVIKQGQIMSEFSRQEATEENIMTAATHAISS